MARPVSLRVDGARCQTRFVGHARGACTACLRLGPRYRPARRPADPALALCVGGCFRPRRFVRRALGAVAEAGAGRCAGKAAWEGAAGVGGLGRRAWHLCLWTDRLRRSGRQPDGNGQHRADGDLRARLGWDSICVGPIRRRLCRPQPVAGGRPRRRLGGGARWRRFAGADQLPGAAWAMAGGAVDSGLRLD